MPKPIQVGDKVVAITDYPTYMIPQGKIDVITKINSGDGSVFLYGTFNVWYLDSKPWQLHNSCLFECETDVDLLVLA